VINIRER
jgi:pimeloyl-ACP methyl ester carboxylesterase